MVFSSFFFFAFAFFKCCRVPIILLWRGACEFWTVHTLVYYCRVALEYWGLGIDLFKNK